MDLKAHVDQTDLKERKDHEEEQALMEILDLRDFKDLQVPRAHLVIPPRVSFTEEERTLLTLKRSRR